MQRTTHSWLEEVAAANAEAAPRLQALRNASLPAEEGEHWAHAQLRSLAAVRNLAPASNVAASIAATEVTHERVRALLPAPIPGAARLVVVDGFVQPSLSDSVALSTVVVLPAGSPAPRFDDVDLRYGLLAALYPVPALQLQVVADVALPVIDIVHLLSGARGSVYPRLNVTLADGATLRLVERLCGGTEAHSLLCTALDIEVGARAQLQLHRLHECGAETLLLDQLQLRLHAAAECSLHQVSSGGASIRQTLSARLLGRGARLRHYGASVHKAAEHYDTLVRVQLDAPQTAVEHRFRALAADRAHVSCSADVLVAASARGADVRQSLRGLNDGRGAHINLRPRLTINTDDIKASHGATTGQLDEQLLFYLLARGIDADTARAMLKWAFLGDVFSTTPDPTLRRAAEELAARHVGDSAMLQLVGSLLS